MALDQPDFDGPEDIRLIQAAQHGEAAAFEPLLDRHLQYVRTFLALKAPFASLVDELAHETFVFAFRNLDQYTPGTSFRAWLREIAWNLLRAETQRRAREQANQAKFAQFREQQMWELAGKRTDLEASREVNFLLDCLEEMPPAMTELLTLKYRQRCSAEEIAAKLDRSIGWVRVVLCRLRTKLRKCVEQKLIEARTCSYADEPSS
ncbi:MAG: sigma-70 family RNA polymerase sigma factor [Verrucomicrobiota bacterium]|jgi:RNA polymerase sigma-70 factor, ECF subfamily